jgi:cell wall-associated NlpC family hydrolase
MKTDSPFQPRKGLKPLRDFAPGFACLLFFTVQGALAQSPAALVEVVRKQYAPDRRTAIFEVTVSANGVLTGKTSLPEAKKALLEKLRTAGVPFTDSVRVLPAASLGAETFGVVRVSVGNVRTTPEHAGELATQALLGMPLKVLERRDEWFRVQTPDQYIAWLDHGAFQRLDRAGLDRWQRAPKLIVTANQTMALTEPKPGTAPVSDLVAGDLLQFLGEKAGHFEAGFPDGRRAFVPNTDAQPYNAWLASLKPTESSLVETGRRFMGLPYLWGGTSAKGVDCSGFTKTVFLLNGYTLPRDASQQALTGEPIDTSTGFGNLRPGDLLFFGKKREDGTERVVHVAMWIGNGRFMHASSMVQINSMDPAAPDFDEYNRNRFLFAKRLLGTPMRGVTPLKSTQVP